MVNIKVSVLERGNVETDDIVVVGRAISKWWRAASEDSNIAMSAVARRPCRYSWALEVSDRRRGSTTSVLKEAKVSG